MTRLEWGVVGTRRYETGVDRGVLYVADQEGVAWPGLISVSESSDGGAAQAYYLDGRKYQNLDTTSWFNATIEAFSSPTEFKVCEGIATLEPGLSATQQAKQPFGFSYRTKIGNDTTGVDHGYKLHLVYNAMASSPGRPNQTINASLSVPSRTWDISARPVSLFGKKAPAHFTIDSRVTPSALLTELEDLLYGVVGERARLVTSDEIISMFVV